MSVSLAAVEPNKVVKYKYGLKVPNEPQFRKIFYARTLDGEAERRMLEAAHSGRTWRQIGAAGGYDPRSFKYLLKLAGAGHPLYGPLQKKMLEAKADFHNTMHEIMVTDVVERRDPEGARRLLEDEERDSLLKNEVPPVSAAGAVLNAKIVIQTDFDEEEECGVDPDAEVVDAEFEEIDG